MQFSIQREVLLKPLQQVVGVVERRQTLPVLANLLVRASGSEVSFTGTDLEVEMVATTEAEKLVDGEITIPARKLFDIVRALPDGARIDLKLNGDRVALSAGRSRFTLTSLRPKRRCFADSRRADGIPQPSRCACSPPAACRSRPA